MAREAAKGYDLLIAGVEPSADAKGGFHPRLTRLAESFDGPFALAIARGALREDPCRPAHGHPGRHHRHRGVAAAAPRSRSRWRGRIAAHHGALCRRRAPPDRNAPAAVPRHRRGENEAILKDIVRLGDQFGCRCAPPCGWSMAAEQAIARQARVGKAHARRPRRQPEAGRLARRAFGHVAGVLMEESEQSPSVVASRSGA